MVGAIVCPEVPGVKVKVDFIVGYAVVFGYLAELPISARNPRATGHSRSPNPFSRWTKASVDEFRGAPRTTEPSSAWPPETRNPGFYYPPSYT